jgi:hypothetical protein
MIKAIFYSKFDTQEGKNISKPESSPLLTIDNRPQSSPSGPRRRNCALVDGSSSRTADTPLHIL